MNDAKVIFDYDAEADDELTLKEGDIIKDIIKKEDGWLEGELYGRRGMFPENFVEEIKKQPSIIGNNIEKETDHAISGSFSEKNKMAKVTFDYDAENEDELTLKEGDIVRVLSQEEEGWWRGELNGKTGVFPTNFVEVMLTEKSDMALNLADSPVIEEKPSAVVKKTTPVTGGIGFGALLTQDALSGIKLKKNKNDQAKVPAKTSEKSETPSELSAKFSAKRTPPQASKTKPAKVIEKACVEYDYDGDLPDELTLKKGDIINILEKDVTEGWWKGELNGKSGLFPDNFVRLLTADEMEKETGLSSNVPEMPVKKQGTSGDAVDNKPNRPEFPKLKPTTDRKPVINGATKKPENDMKGDEKKPPIKKSPPMLPKKPGKPKPPLEKPPIEKPSKEAILDKPQVELRKWNGKNSDPKKRYSEIPRASEFSQEDNLKRHSSGSDVLNFNDIKETQPLQPLTNNRPKNPAKNPPSKWQDRSGGSLRRVTTPEKKSEPEVSHENRPPEPVKPLEKPKKPGVPDHNKPILQTTPKPAAIAETTTDVNLVKKLEKQVDILKKSLDSITKEFREYSQKCENRKKGLEKKMIDEIEDLTREVDEEKKARSALEVEVSRLKKLIKNQSS